MALIILADIIAARAIFKDGHWLSIEDAMGIVKSKAEVDTAENKMKQAELNSVTRGTGAYDPELIQATKEYNDLLDKRTKAEDAVDQANKNLSKSPPFLQIKEIPLCIAGFSLTFR